MSSDTQPVALRLRDDPEPGRQPVSDKAYFLGFSTSLFRLTTAAEAEVRRAGYIEPEPGAVFVRIATFDRPYVIAIVVPLPREHVAQLNGSSDRALSDIWIELSRGSLRTNSPAYQVYELDVQGRLS